MATLQEMPVETLMPRRLDSHIGRSTSVQGLSALMYGLPFVIAGLGGYWAVNSYVSSAADAVDGAKLAFLVLLSSTFLLCGGFFCLHGMLDLSADARKQRLARERPDQPWLGDYAWSADGCKSSARHEIRRPLLTALIGTTVVAPFVWVALRNPTAWAFDVFVLILAAVPAAAWWHCLVAASRAFRFGGSFLKYDAFPFFLGGTLKVHLALKKRNLQEPLTLSLRCVREKYVTTGGGRRWGVGRGITSTECYELFSEIRVLNYADLTRGNAEAIPLEFHLPVNAPGTELSHHPPTYWEVEVAGSGAADYKATFLVPVYSAAS